MPPHFTASNFVIVRKGLSNEKFRIVSASVQAFSEAK